MGEKEWEPLDVLDVFADSHARSILVLASAGPLSADDLADQFDVSRPTIYRRLNALVDYGLLAPSQQIDADGNHYRVYETALRRVTFDINDGGYDIDLQLRQSLTGQFESFWTDFGATSDGPVDIEDQPEQDPTES